MLEADHAGGALRSCLPAVFWTRKQTRFLGTSHTAPPSYDVASLPPQGLLKTPRGDERVVLKKVKARVEVRDGNFSAVATEISG